MKRWVLAACALGAFVIIPGTVALPLLLVAVGRWRERNRVTLVEVATPTAPITVFVPRHMFVPRQASSWGRA